ncbi:MAG: nucleoside triphosphate pyrophosphohydrolase [Candidatus Riflebacteria bacterium]|nr:nucleoside triphosphate pyrophosphohydrolase [Candidatus Riflebacteria bacterium]
MTKPDAIEQFSRLVDTIAQLRSEHGCSWDKKQTFLSMGKHVNNEAQELVEALNKEDLINIKEECGDLIMTVLLTAQIASEAGTFDIADVCEGISEKLIYRHPHVFSRENPDLPPDEVLKQWQEIKIVEKKEKSSIAAIMKEQEKYKSSMMAAVALQATAAETGFDFPTVDGAIQKLHEESAELQEAIDSNANTEEELGDLLFAIMNIARFENVDPEIALRKASKKFTSRFTVVEKLAEENGGMKGKSLAELDQYWDQAKLIERSQNNESH